ncbi:MAG TPA: hypothetical protein VFG83_08915 [Kofleriaceae bacterium]|nr:hypothetical protein [Kofleriaceae bacterium]
MRSVLAAILALIVGGCGGNGGGAPGPADLTKLPADAITRTTQLGPVTAKVSAYPPAPTIGDEVTVVLDVTAKDGVLVTMPAFGEALGRFALIGFAEDAVAGGDVTHHVQRYTLQATRSGPTRIPRLRIEILDTRSEHTDNADHPGPRELLTEPLSIRVATIGDPTKLAELPAPLAALERSADRRPKIWLYGGLLAIAAALLGVSAWLWRKGKRTAEARRPAGEVALARLAALEHSGLPGDAAAAAVFYVDLADIVRRYLDGRFGLRAPERTTEELCAEAQTRADIAAGHRHLIAEFLARCDRVKFASAAATAEESTAAIAAARRLVMETRILAEEVHR